MMDKEYVIYCRRSSDESSGQQIQSIPDQIRKCVDYAKNNGMRIKPKPENFEFETEQDVFKEDNDSDISNRHLFKETRNLYIIKESESAKIPGLRKKWKKLIKLIKDGKIKGLLSYSPDRQARNMLDGGELIDCVDQLLVDLKYTNFHFENTASGKMMLGIWFVFSKQYSDKLSEDITRGKHTAVGKAKSMGRYKYGYYRDESDGYYKPHPKYFPLMKEAFEMKLYAGASDAYIADWLNAQGFLRENKKEKKTINAKMLGNVWTDEFYYGVYIYGDSIVDMRDGTLNPYYQPLINENEHNILREKYERKAQKTIIRTGEHKYEDIRPLPRGMLKNTDGVLFTPYIALIGRFEKKLAILKEQNPNITLRDIVKSNQIRFRIPKLKLEITFDAIEKEIIKLLDKIRINDKTYKKYVDFISTELDRINFENKEKYGKTILQLNRVKGERKEYIKRNIGARKSSEEEQIYQEELNKYENRIEFIQNELNNINTSERNNILEFQIVVEIFQKASQYYKKANNVQKRKICEILFSNIIVSKQKKLTIKVNSGLESMFSSKFSSFGDDGIRTHV